MSWGDNTGMPERRPAIDKTRLAPILLRARTEAKFSAERLGTITHTSLRTVQRWEAAVSAPTSRWRERVAIVLEDASHETWIALVDALGLSRAAMLAKVPGQARKRAPPPPPPKPDPRPILDHAVRAAAEVFDVSPRKVRAAFAQLVVDLERLGLSYAAARDVLLGRSDVNETKP